MSLKRTKSVQTQYIIRELLIKTTLGYHFLLIRRAKNYENVTPEFVDESVEKQACSCIAAENANRYNSSRGKLAIPDITFQPRNPGSENL